VAIRHLTDAEAPAGAALVDAHAEPVEVDGAAAARLLKGEPALLAYARHFLRSDEAALRGYWRAHDGGWLRVSMERGQDVGDGPRAVVALDSCPLPYRLTDRELDVLTLVAGGLTNREIAALIFVSARTVGTHVERLLAKLRQRSRAGVASLAAEEGILRLPVPGGSRGLPGLALGRVEALAEGGRPPTTAPRRRARRPFVLGSAFPLTGPAGGDGAEMRDGSALAVAELNARGGVAGRAVEQVVVDVDIFSPAGVRGALGALVDAEVDAVTTGYVFAEQDACDLVADYGCPFLTAFTSEFQARLVREQRSRYENVFQACSTEAAYGPGFVRLLDDLAGAGAWTPPNRRLLFVETPLQSGHMATEETVRCAERSGWTLDGIELVAAPDADWSAALRHIRATEPAAIMLAHWLPADAAAFQRAFVREPTRSLVLVVYTPSIPAYLELAGRSAEGVLWSTVTGVYADAIGASFAERYIAAYGRPPGRSHAGIAYDAVQLLAGAWARADNPRQFARVAAELRQVPYRGVNGAYYLDTEDQSALSYPDTTPDPSLGQAHLAFQVQRGRHRVLAPAPFVDGAFELPPWFAAAG
jgi:branched-chain amino acid transport system substrate-binding protein